jgi:gluconolactonase
MSLRQSEFVEVARGLQYPEGPVALADGSLAVVEVQAGRLTRLRPGTDPTRPWDVVSQLDLRQPGFGNGPNGAALGPDGALYICNNGGMQFVSVPMTYADANWTLNVPSLAAADYTSGFLEKVDLTTGAVSLLCSGMRSPDDLVFDAAGGLWFTDWGKLQANAQGIVRDITGVYYLAPGAPQAKLVIPERSAPNGILLSPAGDRLYVAETYNRWIVYWDLQGPGAIKPNPTNIDGCRLLTAAIPGCGGLDSMAMDERGNLYAITIMPEGQNPLSRGGITVVSPRGEVIEFIAVDTGVPDPLPSNLCFGGPDRRTAFITLGGTGRVVSCRMEIPGLPPAFAKHCQ